MHASQAQFAVQQGAVQFRHLDDFLDGQHFKRKRGAGRMEAHALPAFALRMVAGRARPGARRLQGQHVGHVFDAQQGVRVEDLQQARAAIEQNRARNDGVGVAARIPQGAALAGGHAQDFARILEDDADQHLLEVEDGDLVRGHGARRVGAEQAAQVDHRNDAAAQGEHAFQIRGRQGQGGDFGGIVDYFADAAGRQGEFIAAQVEGAEQFGGRLAAFMLVHRRFPCVESSRGAPPRR